MITEMLIYKKKSRNLSKFSLRKTNPIDLNFLRAYSTGDSHYLHVIHCIQFCLFIRDNTDHLFNSKFQNSFYFTSSCVPVINCFIEELAGGADSLNGVVCRESPTSSRERGRNVRFRRVIVMFHTGHLSDPKCHLTLVTIDNVTSDETCIRIWRIVCSK